MPPQPNQRRPGDRAAAEEVLGRHPGYEPSIPPGPDVVPGPPSMAARAAQLPLARLLAVIAAAATGIAGIITALGGAVVNIIAALKPSQEHGQLSRRIDAIETRVNGDFGVTLEAETRRKKDEELGKAVEVATSKAASCDGVAARVQKLEDKK